MLLKKTTGMRTLATGPQTGRSRCTAFYAAWLLGALAAWLAVAPSANASRVELKPIGATGGAFCSEVDLRCDGSVGDTFALAITFEIGSEGVRAWNVDLAWDTLSWAKTLTLVASTPVGTRFFLNPSPPPAEIQYNVGSASTVQPSANGEAGRIDGFTQGAADNLSLTVNHLSFRAATVTFEIVNDSKRANVALGFFNTTAASMEGSTGQEITPQFGEIQVNPYNIPEPSTGLLAALGLAWLATRRKARFPGGESCSSSSER